MAWARKIVAVDENVYLVVGLETFGGIDARENEFLVEKDSNIVVVSSPLPCAFWVSCCHLGSD